MDRLTAYLVNSKPGGRIPSAGLGGHYFIREGGSRAAAFIYLHTISVPRQGLCSKKDGKRCYFSSASAANRIFTGFFFFIPECGTSSAYYPLYSRKCGLEEGAPSKELFAGIKKSRPEKDGILMKMVRGIGFEPTTSTMSRCCSTTELTARLEVRADYYPIEAERAILFLEESPFWEEMDWLRMRKDAYLSSYAAVSC